MTQKPHHVSESKKKSQCHILESTVIESMVPGREDRGWPKDNGQKKESLYMKAHEAGELAIEWVSLAGSNEINVLQNISYIKMIW